MPKDISILFLRVILGLGFVLYGHLVLAAVEAANEADMCQSSRENNIIYVDRNATGNDGSSWTNAFNV